MTATAQRNDHMKIRTVISLFVVLLVPGAMNLHAQIPYDDWRVGIKAGNALMTDSLAAFGIRPDATSDYDNAYDIPRPPRAPSGAYLETYFPHSGGSYPPLLGSKYASDIQGPSDPTWSFSVEASANGPIVLTWDSMYVQSTEARVQLFLLDQLSGTSVDMRASGRYVFTYTAKRDFQIIGAVKVNLTFLMEGFWNGATQVQDSVTGLLAQSAPPHLLVDSTKVLLSNAGTGLLVFASAPTGAYYLVVRHRNHLEVWSSIILSLTKGTTSALSPYDFSASGGSAYGSGALKQSGSMFVAWGGDVNQDGVIDYRDRNLTWNNRGQAGYLSTDCDGSNVTDGSDYTIVLDNRLKIVQRP